MRKDGGVYVGLEGVQWFVNPFIEGYTIGDDTISTKFPYRKVYSPNRFQPSTRPNATGTHIPPPLNNPILRPRPTPTQPPTRPSPLPPRNLLLPNHNIHQRLRTHIPLPPNTPPKPAAKRPQQRSPQLLTAHPPRIVGVIVRSEAVFDARMDGIDEAGVVVAAGGEDAGLLDVEV